MLKNRIIKPKMISVLLENPLNCNCKMKKLIITALYKNQNLYLFYYLLLYFCQTLLLFHFGPVPNVHNSLIPTLKRLKLFLILKTIFQYWSDLFWEMLIKCWQIKSKLNLIKMVLALISYFFTLNNYWNLSL